MTISPEQIAEWRTLQGEGLTSAVGEYTPAEFWELLDAYEQAAATLLEQQAEIAGYKACLDEIEEKHGMPWRFWAAKASEISTRAVAVERQNKELREALERSNTALNDWLNLYAPELCDPVRVGEAQARVGAVGTIAYIAEVTAQNRAALVHP